MIVAAAVVPHPPLLSDRLAGAAAEETAELRAACRAVADHLASRSPSWLAVGADPRPGRWGPRTRGSFTGFGDDLVVGLGPDADSPPDPALPLPLLVAGWLRPAGVRIDGLVLDPGATAGECAAAADALVDRAADGDTALLVLGDGAATHTARAPGAFDARAAAFDAGVADALATADTRALAALDPELARALGAAGWVPWRVLAAVADAVDAAGAGDWAPELLHTGHPFGVAYHVARWDRW